MSLFYPLFTTVPDFSTEPQHGIMTAHDRLAIAQGRTRVAFPNKIPDRVISFGFTLDTTAEIREVKEFLRERGGRTHPFYLPSWRNDLPALSGATGSNLLTVTAADYTATHLTEPANRPDHYGRQIFVWQPGQALFATRIIAATEPTTGQTILDLEDLLPFTVNPATAITGFCYLARFAEDRLDWEHWLPDAAKTTIKFRAIRQHNDIEQTNPVPDFDFYGSLGFVSVTQTTDPVQPADNRTGYADGPVNLHYSQDELYATRWAVWTHNGIVRLKRLPSGTISLPDASGTPSALFTGATVATDHISLAFDQNAWEVVAYQKTKTTIELRQYFSGATTIRAWTGIDPVLVFNQLLDPNLDDGDSDVVCYYLKPGENTLFARFQRENFLTENIMAPLPLRPLALKRTWISDQIQYVEILDAGLRSAILETDSYPDPPPPPPPPPYILTVPDPEPATATLSMSGSYSSAIVYSDGLSFEVLDHPYNEDGASAALALLGLYEDATVESSLGAENATTRAAFSGAYELSVIAANLPLEQAQTAATFTGQYTLAIQSAPIDPEEGTTQLAITGTYEV